MITDRHPDIAEMLPEWRTIKDVLAGPRRVKRMTASTLAGGVRVCRDESGMEAVLSPGGARLYSGSPVEAVSPYLPPNPSHAVFQSPSGATVNQYANYLFRAVLLPFLPSLLTRMCGLVLSKPPVVEMPTEEMKIQLRNVTLDGQTVEMFSWDLLEQNLSTGFGLIACDVSSEMGDRPYLRHFSEESIIDYRHKIIDGARILTHVRWSESVDEERAGDPFTREPIEQIKAYDIVQYLPLEAPSGLLSEDQLALMASGYEHGFALVTNYRRERDSGGKRTGAFAPFSYHVPSRNGAPLTFIPVVPNTPFGPTWKIRTPPLSGPCDIILAHFRNSADLEELYHECGAGTVMVASGYSEAEQSQMRSVGSGAFWVSANAQATAAYTQTNGQAGAEIRQGMQDKLKDLATACGRLLLSQQKNVAESGASQEMQFAGDDATLQVAAAGTAASLEAALKIFAWWQGNGEHPDAESVRVEMNDKFIITKIMADEIIGLKTARDSEAITDEDLFWALKNGNALDPETDFEAWQAKRLSREVDGAVGNEGFASLVADIQAARESGDDEGVAAGLSELAAMVGAKPAPREAA